MPPVIIPIFKPTSAAMKPTAPDTAPVFDGSNWEDLTRLEALAKVRRLVETEIDSDAAEVAWVASRFTGPALDWLAHQLSIPGSSLPTVKAAFYDQVREAFGITDANVQQSQRLQLQALQWRSDLPTFFAEFDRLSHVCGMGGKLNAGRMELLRAKIPTSLQTALAQQAFVPVSYEDLRGRLLTMWALDPRSSSGVAQASKTKRPKCGKCGKKGHTASECRSPSTAGN